MNFQHLIIYMFVIIMAASYYLGWTPPLIMLLYVVFSALTYERYAKDKKAAQKGEWRVPEKNLQLLSLLCGWPGAIIAQQRLRHKTKKVEFRAVFSLTVLINIAAFAWLNTHQGSVLLHRAMLDLQNFFIEHSSSNKLVDIVLLLTGFRST
ncbi:MAG: DUF1294 domain-containing protein [Pseudomonadales bacterium]|nr:DUF1294 domain-containing protein [Pseudomonadales bacterium]